jgi:hypothetical protein
MVNHTRNEDHNTVVIITQLIILGMSNYNYCIMLFIPSMINHVIITNGVHT